MYLEFRSKRVMQGRRVALLVSALLWALLAVFVPVGCAQYFGKNKVQYHTFNFKVLHTKHFDIYYYPAEHNPAVQVGRMAERWYTRLSTLLKWQLSSRQPVILYANGPDFRSTTVIPGMISEATGGVTEPLRRRVVIPVASSMAETDHVLGHELVHAFQYDITARSSRMGGAGFSNIERLPLWFIEGMAEYLSIGPHDPNTAMWMRDAVRSNKLPAIKDLNNPKYFPYRWGQALWAYIGGRWGDAKIGAILRAGAGSGSAKSALENTLHISEGKLSEEWQDALRRAYDPVLATTVAAGKEAHLLIAQSDQPNSMNVSPVISPNGKYVMFFSSRGLFAINVYLADASTGKIVRKITSTALNPHIDSLDFVSSVGAWSRDSTRFAYGVVSHGRPQLNVYDVQKDDDSQHFALPTLGEVLGLSWSPDGSKIAISGKSGGVTNLFLLDLDSKRLRHLTNDAFTELEPAWSPDGSRIAFVTDRFTSDAADLSFGEYRLGLIDPGTGKIQEVPSFNRGKAINPQWSRDGSSLYFVSDRNGIDNLYSVSLAGGELRQITNLQTGITGITALSPAMSVAGGSGRTVFSVYENGDYVIYRLDAQSNLANLAKMAGSAPSDNVARLHPAMLPPRQRDTGEIASYLQSPKQGLAIAEAFRTTPYHRNLQLEYIAPPTFSAGMSNYGAMVGGGIGFYFGDMLNTRSLMLATQINSFSTGGLGHFYNNLAGVAAYEDLKHRWHWGFSGGQIPFLSGYTAAGPGPVVSGTPTASYTQVATWQINRQFLGNVQYPFNRAMRVEFSGGYQRIDFAAAARQQIVDPAGNIVSDRTVNLPDEPGLNLGVASTALVYDNSIFGGTGPIMGQRYRLEVGASGGSLSFGHVLIDYRKYFRIAKPLIFAARFLHYGRYGGDSDDPRMSDLFLGFPGLVHGYEAGSFTPADCGPRAAVTGNCPILNRLVGSKIAVVNGELRTPLLGALGVIPSRGAPPLTNAIFYDAGVAWTGRQKAYFLGGPREPVRSYGDSLRFNLFGYTVLQFSLVKPVDRPHKGWMFEFSILPGF